MMKDYFVECSVYLEC